MFNFSSLDSPQIFRSYQEGPTRPGTMDQHNGIGIPAVKSHHHQLADPTWPQLQPPLHGPHGWIKAVSGRAGGCSFTEFYICKSARSWAKGGMSRNEFLTMKWAIEELRYYLFPFHNCDQPYSNTINDKGKNTNAREFSGVWPFRTGKERAQHNTTCLILLCFSSDMLETKEDIFWLLFTKFLH